MTFRARLLALVVLAVILTVGLVTWSVAVFTRRSFERLDDQRAASLVAQFRREFDRRAGEVVSRAAGVAATESIQRMVVELSRAQPDYSVYVNLAGELAATHGLDFLQLADSDGTILSSAQWPARFGYKLESETPAAVSKAQGAFLKREELPGEVALALNAVETVRAGERNFSIVAGRRLDKEFLASLVLPEGMRVLLYRNLEAGFSPQALIDASGVVAGAARLAPLIGQVQAEGREFASAITWSHGPETLQAIPLKGPQNNLLGVLLVASSRRELAELVGRIRWAGIWIGGAGVLLGILLSYWVTARVTRPVEQLAAGAGRVAAGDWDAQVEVSSGDEIGTLAAAFNVMTGKLAEQRDRLVQAERVAAWRELARRLAHELKNPLFPLQITVENLQRARQQAPEQFEEVFRESTATLLGELANLKTIIGRFSDFAKMPPPQFEPVNLNEVVRRTMRLFEPQLRSEGRPAIDAALELDGSLGTIQADPNQLSGMLQNLLLNAIDAMPSGGALSIRTRRRDGMARLELADSGQGLTPEERDRLFTPYYTTKQHGTGLGLAIVQSVVSDHRGNISVESQPGHGTTFRIELPENHEPSADRGR